MIRQRKLLLSALGVLLIVLLASFQYSRRIREYRSEHFLMDTLISIKVYGRNQEVLKKAVAEAFAEMRRIAELADGFPQPGTAAYGSSDVCRINAQAGKQPVMVDNDIMAMLELAKKYHHISLGAFDVTIGPLMELWGFGGEAPHVPDAHSIQAALARVGSDKLVLNGHERTAFLTKAGMKLDLGAMAKGYAAEKAIWILEKNGIEKALIDAGGNVRTLGRNVHEAPWKIGVKDPRKSAAVTAVLQLENASAVTSGDYYRYFEAGGKRYNHILDPRSGYPAVRTMSATVVTKDAGLADILSTVFFVLPPEKALETAGKMSGVEVFLVTADGRILHSSSLKGRIEVLPGDSYRYDQGR